MTLADLQENPQFAAAWPYVGTLLESYLTARVLTRARAGNQAEATKELALLIEDLRQLALPVNDKKVEAPRMKPLNSMSEKPNP